ncbi:unnamed protein product [Lactuca saligna]|uniref:Uncharacterized protein n=1 Tax=Lactuca saligna TaxID=75948 RepID=A0AA35YVT4_LACSI|nr:unnamed protein product [Lactuca saligna]
MESSLGGFGRQFRDEHDDVDMNDETGGEVQQLAYTAILEQSYGLILREKSTMEVALKDGLEKFLNSVVLKEWMEKMNELFREVHEGANNKKVNEPEGYNELNMNDMVDGYGGNSSLVRGLVINEVNVEKDVNYNTHTNALTMSQFHRLSGVNDEMIKLLEETELQVHRRKQLTSGFSGDYVVERNLGEVVDNAAKDVDNDKREKCIPKKAKIFHSQYIKIIFKVGDKLTKDETEICNLVFASNRGDW